MGDQQIMSPLTVVARGEYIIGWDNNNNISPIFNTENTVIVVNMKTRDYLEIRRDLIWKLGVYSDLPPQVRRTNELVLSSHPPNQSAYPGIYGHQYRI